MTSTTPRQLAKFQTETAEISLIVDFCGAEFYEIGIFPVGGGASQTERFNRIEDAYDQLMKQVGFNATALTADDGLQLVTVDSRKRVWQAAGHVNYWSGTPDFAEMFAAANPGRVTFRVDGGAAYRARLGGMFNSQTAG